MTISKNVQGRFRSLMSIPAIITAVTLTRVETDFRELVFYLCWIPLYHYADAGVYKWPFHPNSQDFCISLANRSPENTEPASTS